MTNERLAEIEARLAAIRDYHPHAWSHQQTARVTPSSGRRYEVHWVDYPHDCDRYDVFESDGPEVYEFAAHAPEDLADLLAEVKRLRGPER